MNPSEPAPHERLTWRQILVLVLSVYILAALGVRTIDYLPAETRIWLDRIDFWICLFFLYDFGVRCYEAPDKRAFMRWGWIDLLGSIPALPWFRVVRLVRVFRILRMLRVFRAAQRFMRHLFRQRAEGTLLAVLISAMLLMGMSAIAILNVENVPEANIKTPSDALWWAFVTITTVGYGDKFPVTAVGRLIAAGLMIVGVGLFGTFTGYIAKFFVEEDQAQDDTNVKTLLDEIRKLHEKLDRIEKGQQAGNEPPAAP